MPRTRITATNFEMFSGNTRILKVTVLDQDDAIVDLSGASADFALSKRPGSTALVTKSVGTGITITDAVAGELEVRLDPADTEPLAGGHYYELEVQDASGRRTTVLFGTIQIRKNTA